MDKPLPSIELLRRLVPYMRLPITGYASFHLLMDLA